jgi:hypothetical protein
MDAGRVPATRPVPLSTPQPEKIREAVGSKAQNFLTQYAVEFPPKTILEIGLPLWWCHPEAEFVAQATTKMKDLRFLSR